MSDPKRTERIITQGRALVRAIEALSAIEPTNRLERRLAKLLLYVYKRRLRGLVEAAPSWVSEEVLSASEQIGGQRAAVWMSEN